MLLFHSPTIVKVIGMVGLSFRLLTFLQKMRYRSYPYWWGKGQRNRARYGLGTQNSVAIPHSNCIRDDWCSLLQTFKEFLTLRCRTEGKVSASFLHLDTLIFVAELVRVHRSHGYKPPHLVGGFSEEREREPPTHGGTDDHDRRRHRQPGEKITEEVCRVFQGSF